MGEKSLANADPRLLAFFNDGDLIAELYNRNRIRELYCRTAIDRSVIEAARIDIVEVTHDDMCRQFAHHLLSDPTIVKIEEKDDPDDPCKTLQMRVMVVTNPSPPAV